MVGGGVTEGTFVAGAVVPVVLAPPFVAPVALFCCSQFWQLYFLLSFLKMQAQMNLAKLIKPNSKRSF